MTLLRNVARRRSENAIALGLAFVAGTLINLPCALAQDKLVLGRDGHTTYSIYLDPAAPNSVQTAARNLKSYFNKVAGFSPQIVTSAQPPDGDYISLGSTPAARAAGLDASKIPPYDGFRIVTRGSDLFILGLDTPAGQLNNTGGTYNGTANGVYTFIEDYLGVHWLGGEFGDEYSTVETVEIPALDRTESSPFPYRWLQSRNGRDTWQRYWKLGRNVKISHAHDWFYTIPAEMFDQHPTWFAEVGGVRLKPTNNRYKLDTLNPELVQAYANRIIESFRKNPGRYSHSISPNDGSYGWSDSAATKAWMETSPNGKLSRTPLILKFYNDVAKIVGREFPDRKLGCYIYTSFLFPPQSGIPRLEPNLAPVLATSNSYGYQLLRPSTRDEWDKNMRTWGDAARAQGIDLYYYDLPISLRGGNGIQPPAPEMLNFIFSRVAGYGYKGGDVAGTSGIGNYLVARLLWNPHQDAVALAHEYYMAAYGPDAGPHMEQMYKILNEAFTAFYTSHPTASYTLRPEWVDDLYGSRYTAIEKQYLLAREAAKEEKYRRRIELLAKPFSQLQQNLKKSGALPQSYKSALTPADSKNAAQLPGTSNVNDVGERVE